MMLLAQCCENNVVPHVLPFVEDNIRNDDWKIRDAAVMAFGERVTFTIKLIVQKCAKCLMCFCSL